MKTSLTLQQTTRLMMELYMVLKYAPYTSTYADLRETVMKEMQVLIDDIEPNNTNMFDGEVIQAICKEVETEENEI